MGLPFWPHRFVCLVVSAPGMCPSPWFVPGRGLAESFNFFLHCCYCGQCFLVGIPHIGLTPFCQRFPPLPLEGAVLRGPNACQLIPGHCLCLCPLQSLKEDATSSINSGSPGGNRGSVCGLYTLRYKDCNSSFPEDRKQGLRSDNMVQSLLEPRRKLKTFASRAFSVISPRWWNQLPNHVKSCDNLTDFKKLLKTYLFINDLN